MNASNYAILWDMDGTLIDTAKLHFQSWVEILNHYKIDLPYDIFLQYFGKNNQVFVLNFFPDADQHFIDMLGFEKEKAFCEAAKDEAPLYPGALEWLETFHQNGYKQAIASSAPMMNIDVLVDSTGIRKYFNHLASGGLLPTKPAPDIFLSAAKNVNVSAQHCLVIEDAPPGIQGAVNAGMKSVAITNSHPAASLTAANLIFDQFSKQNLEITERLLTSY
jgi:HAD superfamily hydrolase (TIGR01509 family)